LGIPDEQQGDLCPKGKRKVTKVCQEQDYQGCNDPDDYANDQDMGSALALPYVIADGCATDAAGHE
jgi:hypothetical protein